MYIRTTSDPSAVNDAAPKTSESYRSILTNHLLPEFGERAIGSIEYPEVLTFLSRLSAEGKGAGTVRNIRDVMRLVLALAVRSGAIKANPVEGIKAPRAQGFPQEQERSGNALFPDLQVGGGGRI